MPVQFKIQEAVYNYPEGWQDVNLAKWVKSLEQLKKPELLTRFHAIQDAGKRQAFAAEFITDEVYKRQIFPYFVDFFCFWSDCPREETGKLKKDVFENYYRQLESNFSRSMKQAEKYEETIEHRGQKWFLPNQHLQDETVNTFIEAAQLEFLAKQLQENQLAAIPDMLCMFLRKTKGEVYRPELLKRKPLFMDMPMTKVFQVAFFLLKLNEKYLQNSLIYMGLSRLSQHPHKRAQA